MLLEEWHQDRHSLGISVIPWQGLEADNHSVELVSQENFLGTVSSFFAKSLDLGEAI